MKKKLVVLLAVVMMFAFSASAYAATFSDISERPVVEQDAIKKAVALGIIEGYEDGTFGPDKTITRAEFAKIAVTAAGAKDTATMLEANASSFKDVKANSWYTGWINAGESLGIFKGDANGNFRPNDTISNQEAITVMLRLLGYNDNLTGSWPVNYVTKANQINILDDVNIVASAAAKRGDIVVMLSETLDSDLVTYDKDTNEFVKKQIGITNSQAVTLLADSFEGSYIEVNSFFQIDQLRDVSAQTLNWNVGKVLEAEQVTTNGVTSTYNRPVNFKGTLIVDKDTAVSYNATDLFNLENHQGKVYYVKGNDGKLYARFIEVESYVQTVTDTPKATESGSRVQVNKTNYNAANTVDWGTNAPSTGNTDKNNGAVSSQNTNYSLYFNDDDQVYMVRSDKDFEEKTYYIKSVSASSARLVGTKTKTVNMSDADTLIYDGDKFISPSDLKVGDAVREIAEGDLYVKVADANGTLTRWTESTQKITVGGKSYVVPNSAQEDTENNTTVISINFYEEDLNDSDVSIEDVYNNNIRYILNKDNTVAAIIVDETSTGTTLYGIIVDGGGNGGSWAKNMSSITLFTQEGNTVTYDFEKNMDGKPTDDDAYTIMGRLAKYKLNANGEIKNFEVIKETGEKSLDFTAKEGKAGEIEVKNNAYLVDTAGKSFALASNVIIFEVGNDKTDIDPSLVTRSALLGGGDFTPVEVENVTLDGTNVPKNLPAYAVYDLNTNGAIKVLAYTDASNTKYHYGIVKAYNFRDYDNDHAITLVGDEETYELAWNTATNSAKGEPSKADAFIVYTLSGEKIEPVYSYANDHGLSSYAKQVIGFNSGLISFADKGIYVAEDKSASEGHQNDVYRNSIMTDANTQVFVIDAKSGDYVEGALSDISRNSYVYVPVINKDSYAEVVLVDDYHSYKADSDNNGTTTPTTYSVTNLNLKVVNADGDEVQAGSLRITPGKQDGNTYTFSFSGLANGQTITPINAEADGTTISLVGANRRSVNLTKNVTTLVITVQVTEK